MFTYINLNDEKTGEKKVKVDNIKFDDDPKFVKIIRSSKKINAMFL